MHVGDVGSKVQEARDTLFMAEENMDSLGVEFERLRKIKMDDDKVREYIRLLIPMEKNPTQIQEKNTARLRDDMAARYFHAPDLKGIGNNAYRFINAVSDFATHAKPIRQTANYRENLFGKTIDGNPLIDRAYQLVKATA